MPPWELAKRVTIKLTTRAAFLFVFVSFPVAFTSTEIPFLSYGALLQSSAAVSSPFQLLP